MEQSTMSGTRAERGMRFSCDQRWDDMEARGTDRFCQSCQKPVIDLTGWERDELQGWFEEHPHSCGMYRAEQVDRSLVAIADMDLGARRGLLAALAALTLTTAQAQSGAPTPAATEQSPIHAVPTIPAERVAETNVDRCWVEKETILPETPRKHHWRRRTLYISKRFPFVHYRRRHVLGMRGF
ncbi:MAG TPA: hypothetical protein VKG92_07950 [Flavobacteriales bacterium]|nr:hypothetical protein [Flavobacteriales bacterium]